jgi:hypothetical protein
LDCHLSEFRRIVTNPTIPQPELAKLSTLNTAREGRSTSPQVWQEETVMTKPPPSQKLGRKVTLPQLPSLELPFYEIKPQRKAKPKLRKKPVQKAARLV